MFVERRDLLFPGLVVVIPCAIWLLTSIVQGASSISMKQMAGFDVMGISARTDNASEMSGRGEIGKIWQKFMDEHLAATIPAKVGNEIIALYTEYESDQQGRYTYLLGVKVSSIAHVPQGFTGRHVPPGRYAVFTSEKGPLANVVPKAWQQIWATSPQHMGGTRAFLSDYEIYDERAQNPANGQVDLYVGLR